MHLDTINSAIINENQPHSVIVISIILKKEARYRKLHIDPTDLKFKKQAQFIIYCLGVHN